MNRVVHRICGYVGRRRLWSTSSAARSPRKDGFVLNERGVVQPTNPAARQWLEAGLFDDIKRQGTATYQDRMAEILGLSGCEHRYVFELRDQERRNLR